jgi:type I restriction enzyme, S subunit
MKIVKLTEVVKKLESGARPKGGVSSDSGTIPSLGAEHLADDGGFNFHKTKYITNEFYDSLNSGKIQINDILIVKDGATTGKVSFVEKDFPFDKAGINEHVFRIAIEQTTGFAKYVYFFLKSSDGKKQILNDFRGATVGGISRQFIESAKIPLPSRDDQIRIATVLTRAEKLIAKRKESIKALDELLKSTFLEMFGLSNTDYKKWDIEPLGASTEIVSGITKGKKYGASILRAVPYMRVANVQDGHLNLSEIKTIEVTENEIRQYELKKGDLLLTEGGDPDKLGRGAVWNDEIDECIHQNHIFRVRAKDTSINPVFLSALMASKYGKSYFLKAAKQTTGIASINSTQLKAFPLIKPPVALQNQFASIVTKVEALKSKYTQSLTELENLYGTLSQSAFKGELELSKVSVEHSI